jgi:hypothetical protein
VSIVSICVVSSVMGTAHASEAQTEGSAPAEAEARPVADTSTTSAARVDESALCEAIGKVLRATGQRFADYRGEPAGPRQWHGTLVMPGTEQCTIDNDRRYACVHAVDQGEAGAEAAFAQYVGAVRRCLPNRKEEAAKPGRDDRVKSVHFYEPVGDVTSQVYVVKSYRADTRAWYVAIYVNVPE